jgi:hypothetical protein
MSKSRDIADSAATINYIDGLTSDAQSQLDTATADIATNTADIATNTTDIATKAPIASPSFTGGADVAGELIATSYNETYVALSGTSPSVDCESGNVFSLTTSGTTTFTFSNPPATGTAYGMVIKLTAGGTHTINWPASVDWAGATAPDAPASGETDILCFITYDGGTTWYGFLGGDAMA